MTGLRATISHQTMACPAIVIAVRSNPLIANKGTKYVKIDADGILAVFRGTCEFLFKTVGTLKTASPALPIEIRISTRLNCVTLFLVIFLRVRRGPFQQKPNPKS